MNKISRIYIPDPEIGGKPYLLNGKGIYVLEEGPGMLQVVDITHSGSGELDIYDGVPNDNGYFPDNITDESDSKWPASNGRRFVGWSPIYMGAWQMNAGFRHGLTVISSGGADAPYATFVWVAMKKAPVIPPKASIVPKPDTVIKSAVKDVKVPASAGSLMRSVSVSKSGLTRIARRTSELYSVMIAHAGSFCELVIRDGFGVPLFKQPSTFTGSFVIGGCAKGGIIVDLRGNQQMPTIQINWREPDTQLV